MTTDTCLKNLHSRAFVDGGMYVLRSKMSYLLFVAHKVGVFSTGPHKHNDTLSLEWCVGDQPIFIDPGTGCYTSNLVKKNHYRSTQAHNTVVVDGEEQISIVDKMFALNNISGDVELVNWCDDGFMSEVSAKHTYYTRLSESVVHQRTVQLNKSSHLVTVKDILSGRGVHKLEWYFHLSPNLKAVVTDNQFIISLDNNAIATLSYPDAIDDVKVISGVVSQGYNMEVNAQVLYCKCNANCGDGEAFVFQMKPVL